MNKRQKSIYKLAKWMHIATLRNSNITPTFKETYKRIRYGYSRESDEYIKELTVWAKRQAILGQK
jgi:bifunctional pyridoxal-dependent enzyme with beta-cystathionase and maltose regulon repressor activities